jgi:membrane protease YdiL (CAAX protease family)
MRGNLRKAGLFIGLTFLANYLLLALYLAFGGRWVMPGSTIVATAYMFIPMVIAIVVQRLFYKQPLREPFRISFRVNRWFLVAWLLPPVVAFATLGVSLLLPGVAYSPEMVGLFERLRPILSPEQLDQLKRQVAAFPIHPLWVSLLGGLLAGATINAVAGFGEELGWRGLLLRELSSMGFWRSSAVIGLVWGIWHAPIILQGHNYPQHPLAGVFMMVVFTLLLAPIFTYITVRADSVIAAAVMHGTLNGTAGIPLLVIKGGSDLTVGVTGLAGFIVLALVDLGIFVYDRFVSGRPLDTLLTC